MITLENMFLFFSNNVILKTVSSFRRMMSKNMASIDLEHIVMYDLLVLPSNSIKERQRQSMTRPLLYGGTFLDLHSLIKSG